MAVGCGQTVAKPAVVAPVSSGAVEVTTQPIAQPTPTVTITTDNADKSSTYGAVEVTTDPATQPAPAVTTNNAASPTTYTLAQVASHNNVNDCWTAIDGKVYNITSYAKSGQHPAGDVILQGCGVDASQMFAKHSDKARQNLQNFYLGNLAQ
jgi:cytochrome b involved in lipid metabolism